MSTPETQLLTSYSPDVMEIIKHMQDAKNGLLKLHEKGMLPPMVYATMEAVRYLDTAFLWVEKVGVLEATLPQERKAAAEAAMAAAGIPPAEQKVIEFPPVAPGVQS